MSARPILDAQFFGYGSLVNHATHGYENARPAHLGGWRRRWVSTSLRPVAFLSVEPWPEEIAGLVAEVPGGDWSALDKREAAYAKHPVTPRLQACGSDAPSRVYAVAPTHVAPVGPPHPFLLSYLDTVVQGFLEVFGSAGAEAFFTTTVGWESPILDDRAAPRYPRATPLTPAEQRVVDDGLAAVVK